MAVPRVDLAVFEASMLRNTQFDLERGLELRRRTSRADGPGNLLMEIDPLAVSSPRFCSLDRDRRYDEQRPEARCPGRISAESLQGHFRSHDTRLVETVGD